VGVAKPDEFGRYRVIDADTGHEYSTSNYIRGAHKIADGPASDVSGNPVAPVHNAKVAERKAPEPQDSPERLTAIIQANTDNGQEAL
jgi:hypothetical protein